MKLLQVGKIYINPEFVIYIEDINPKRCMIYLAPTEVGKGRVIEAPMGGSAVKAALEAGRDISTL